MNARKPVSVDDDDGAVDVPPKDYSVVSRAK